MAKKKPECKCENHERWLLPYADMITLMLAFFIIMYALGLEDKGKMQEFAIAVRSAMGLPGFMPPAGKTPPVPGRKPGKFRIQGVEIRPEAIKPGAPDRKSDGGGAKPEPGAEGKGAPAGRADAGAARGGPADMTAKGGPTDADAKGGAAERGAAGATGVTAGMERGGAGRAGDAVGGATAGNERNIGGIADRGNLGATGRAVGPERGGPEKQSGVGLAVRGDQGASGLAEGAERGGMSAQGDAGARGLRSGDQAGGRAESGDRGAAGDRGDRVAGHSEAGNAAGGLTETAGPARGGRGAEGEKAAGSTDTGAKAAGAADTGAKAAGAADTGAKAAGIADAGAKAAGTADTGAKAAGTADAGVGVEAGRAARPGFSDIESVGGVELPREPGARTLALLMALQRMNAEAFRSGDMTMEITDRGLEISFRRNILFEFGTARLTPEAKRVLAGIAATIRLLPGRNDIRIEGHTDAIPVNTFLYPSNWELSAARATAVVRQLVDYEGLEAARFGAAGFGEHRPIDTNETPEGRANNRRIDVVILSDPATVETELTDPSTFAPPRR